MTLKTVAPLAAGLLIGALLTYVFVRSAPPDPLAPIVVRDIVEVPVMSIADAESHRADKFDRIRTIEQTLALPGDFSQTEALYVIAGRANSAEVQNLIGQANRIADPTDRDAALSILFLRLAELDPLSALTMARMREFTSSRGLENSIWRTWSKLDLDAAIAAAQDLRNPSDRNIAAQTMLAAYGFMGNEVTDRIEAELGIRASDSSRARYLYSIADRSPAEAINYINNLPPMQQGEAVNWLAAYLGQRNPAQAQSYASMIANPAMRRQFQAAMKTATARLDPVRILNEMPPGGFRGNNASQYMMAMQSLAASDIESALSYYDAASSPQARQLFGSIIAQELAKQDVDRAIEWAQNQQGPNQELLTNVLQQVALTDPDLAFSKIELLTNRETRRQTTVGVVSAIARNDPQRAVAYIDQIGDQGTRSMAMQNVVQSWAHIDPEAAVGWVLGSGAPNTRELLSYAGHSLISNDVDSAMRLLPRVDDQTAQEWRMSIAATLSQQRGSAAAQRFIEQFENESDYDNLQAAVINSIAQQDPYQARRMAEQLPPGSARDSSMAQLVMVQAQSYPHEAATWIDSISDENVRGQAASMVAREWMANDPAAASQWVINLPPGSTRDDAIVSAVQRAGDRPALVDQLIGYVDDPRKRQQAEMSRLWQIARYDPSRARAMLAEMNLPDEQRQQLEAQLQQMQQRH